MVIISLTGILSQKHEKHENEDSSPSWKPKSRPAQRDSIVTKNEGNDVKLTCGVNGNPKPSIKWYKDGRIFDDKKRSKTKLHRYSLIMKDAQVDDKGDYQCIVTNVHGSLNFTFYVTVIKLTWPLEVEEPQNQTVNEGDDAIFTCRPLNDPDATIKWVKRNQTGLQTSIGKTSDILENKEMLVLRSVTMKDAGHYVCFVGNYFGLKQVDVWLTVIPTPTTTTTTSTTTTTPTTTTTTPTTTTTTPTTTKPSTTTPTTTTPTTTTTTTTTTMKIPFWPEPTPDWDDDFDDTQRKKDKKKKKKKDKKKKNKKDRKKKKKNKKKNREDTSYMQPEIYDKNYVDTKTPNPDNWFGRTGRIDPDDPYDQGIVPEPFNPTLENDQIIPYGENNKDETIDYSDVDFTGKTQGENTSQKKSAEKDIDVWTIYIIVGSVAGGVLLIGVVAIVVALCCNRYEDDGYKHTNV